eukprot:scaffold21759_cov36-Phaeocystis_antarctica.AAC.1
MAHGGHKALPREHGQLVLLLRVEVGEDEHLDEHLRHLPRTACSSGAIGGAAAGVGRRRLSLCPLHVGARHEADSGGRPLAHTREPPGSGSGSGESGARRRGRGGTG